MATIRRFPSPWVAGTCKILRRVLAAESNRESFELPHAQHFEGFTVNYDELFTDEQVNMPLLRQRAFNLRWAQQPDDVLALTAADPDFPVAPEIRKALGDYVSSGVLSYGPAEGLPSFRRVVADTLMARRNIDCTPERILAADSAASAMFVIARYALRPGDEVIIFDPVDFLFKASAEVAGAKAVLCPIDSKTGTIDMDGMRKLITPKTKMISVCNPHNPLGLVLSEQDLRAIGEMAVEHDLWIMNDEIWSDIVFDPVRFVSIASLSPEIARRTMTVCGFSKNYGLAGLRIGFLVAPTDEVYEGLVAVSTAPTTAWGAATLSQVGAQAAYEHGGPWLDAFLRHLTKIRDYAAGRLANMPGITVRPPDATYLLFPDITAYGMSSTEMADYLLEEARVAVVPGAAQWFGPGAEGHIRIAFPTSMAIISEALDRIEAALAKRA
ncbi:MAG: pyridoxal phosphate-dependent aminotransferase [Acidimicrobiales bacterium]